MRARNSEQGPLPLDTWYLIISRSYLGTRELCCMALVSKEFRELAQRQLFDEISFRYYCWDNKWDQIDSSGRFKPNWSPFNKKVNVICNSQHICRHVRRLSVVACYPLPMDSSCTRFSHPIFASAIERELAPSLLRMVNLRRIFFKAPFMLEKLHQAILLHRTLETIVISSNTLCRRPCSVAVKESSKSRIRELHLIDWSFQERLSGYESRTIGPRPCALTTRILITHRSFLQTLVVTIPLLHQAMIGAPPSTQFPHLSSLSVYHITSLWETMVEPAFGGMLSSLSVLLTNIQRTLKNLNWDCDVSLSDLGKDRGLAFPALETLQGGPPVVNALLSSHSLKCFAIRRRAVARSEDTALSLRQCRVGSPHLSRLKVEENSLFRGIAKAISQFDHLEELAYWVDAPTKDLIPELQNICSDREFTKARLGAIRDFLNSSLPSLPRLRSLSVTTSDCERSFLATTAYDIVEMFSSLQSDSLTSLEYLSVKPLPPEDKNRTKENQKMHLQWVTDGDGKRNLIPGELIISKSECFCTYHTQNCSDITCLATGTVWFSV